jgi:hypothetical protein
MQQYAQPIFQEEKRVLIEHLAEKKNFRGGNGYSWFMKWSVRQPRDRNE